MPFDTDTTTGTTTIGTTTISTTTIEKQRKRRETALQKRATKTAEKTLEEEIRIALRCRLRQRQLPSTENKRGINMQRTSEANSLNREQARQTPLNSEQATTPF